MNDAISSFRFVRDKIVEAERAAHRPHYSTKLVVVSKNFDASIIRPILDTGHRIFGENRVQEANSKWRPLKKEYDAIELHLIGPLQSNKVREAVQLFDVIETIDREKIAQALSDEMNKQNRFLPCFVQVNTGLEPQKAGIDPKKTLEFVTTCQNKYQLNVVGLMAIPPIGENPGPHFALLRKLAQQCALKELSMGMSHDFQTAIAFGATLVRVGSAIFGERNSPYY